MSDTNRGHIFKEMIIRTDLEPSTLEVRFNLSASFLIKSRFITCKKIKLLEPILYARNLYDKSTL
jgi:hypothetical protein